MAEYNYMFLKVARKNAGHTQKSAAEKTGIPLGTIRRWEQGVSEPDMLSIITLAECYGVTTDELVGVSFNARHVSGIVNEIAAVAGMLNEEGCEKVLEYAELLYRSGDYRQAKNRQHSA